MSNLTCEGSEERTAFLIQMWLLVNTSGICMLCTADSYD